MFCGLEIEFLFYFIFFSSLLLLGISKYLKLNTFLPASQSAPHGEKVDVSLGTKILFPSAQGSVGTHPCGR